MADEGVKTILVVDDDGDVRESFREAVVYLLEGLAGDLSIDVRTANGGAEAIEFCRQVNPSLILMDLFMPEIDGIEAYWKIREAIGANVPTFVLTAYAGSSVVRSRLMAAVGEGLEGWLSKPVSLDELERIIRTIVLGQELEEVDG